MGANRGTGSRAGVSGIFSLQNGQQFTGHVYAWQRGLKIPQTSRTGRGGPRWGSFRRLDVGSTVSFKMTGGGMGWPAPVAIENSGGTVVIQFDAGKKISCTGDIIEYSEAYNGGRKPNESGTDEEWDIGVTLRLSAAPSYAGWPGSQPSPSAQTFADQEEDEGLSKTVDPNLLASTAHRQIDVTVSDSDSAEVAKVQAHLSDAVPIPNTKVRTAGFTRTDRTGGKVSAEYAYNDTKDELLLPQNVTSIDPNAIRSHIASGLIYPSSAAAPSVIPPVGFKTREVDTVAVNPLWNNQRRESGLLDTKDDITFPQTERVVDQYQLHGHATSAQVLAQAFPAVEGYLTSGDTLYKKVTDSLIVATKNYQPNNSIQEITFPKSPESIDPLGLESRSSVAGITSGAKPAASLLQSTTTDYVQLTPGRFLSVQNLELNNTAQKQTFPASPHLIDPFGIDTSLASAVVQAGTIPGASGLTSAATEYRQLTPGKFLSVTKLEPLNSVDKLQIGGTHSVRSAASFADIVASVINSTATDATEANTQFAAHQADSFFQNLEVRSINKQKKLLVLQYDNVGTRVRGSVRGGARWLPAVLNGSSIQVYLSEVRNISSGLKKCRHKSVCYQSLTVRRFLLIRWFSTAPPIPDHASLIGTVNQAAFLGLPIGTVMYDGLADFDVNIGLSGNIPMFLVYEFHSDQAGLFDYQGVQDDWFYTTTAAATGFNNASLFSTEKTIQVLTPTPADFSVF